MPLLIANPTFFVCFVVKKHLRNVTSALSVAGTLVLVSGFEETRAATVDVLLHERVVAAAPVVRLGDVARIVTADRQRARQLSSLLLMPSPAPGTQRFLRRREVEDLLAAHGEDMARLRVDGATQVEITTPKTVGGIDSRPVMESQARTPMNRHAAILAGYTEPIGNSHPSGLVESALREDIKRSISNYIVAQTGKQVEWRVSGDVRARYLAQLDMATSPPICSGGKPPWTGRQQFIISFLTAEGAVRFPVHAEVEPAASPVVVAIQPIARGAVITAADVEIQTPESAPAANDRRAAFTSLEQLIGMEARQAIAAGDVIFTDKVQSPLLVKRGELIRVVSQAGGIRVSTTARARQDGSRGELVQLESLETRETYEARVTGYREAGVFVAASAAAADYGYSAGGTPIPPAPPVVRRIDTARR